MSILIKGMEMPVTCCHCPLMGYDPDIEWVDGGRETQGAYICVITHELIDNTKREEHCPLVEIPPHGRLIEEVDAAETAWMILRGLGYLKEENPQLEQTVREVFATAPAIEVE
jgi:hypothetical protein